MTDLMEELAEPLLRMGEEKTRKISPEQEETQLHFIRCIKPRPKPESEGDRPGLFVHSMTLQQITYMGVLESVDLKQKNFPFRKKFEEFYADFELLSPRFATLRYYQMKQRNSPENWEALSTDIMNTQMQGCG